MALGEGRGGEGEGLGLGADASTQASKGSETRPVYSSLLSPQREEVELPASLLSPADTFANTECQPRLWQAARTPALS